MIVPLRRCLVAHSTRYGVRQILQCAKVHEQDELLSRVDDELDYLTTICS